MKTLTLPTPPRALSPLLLALPVCFAMPMDAQPQGCVPVRAYGSPLLPSMGSLDSDNPWQASVAYRYLYADRYFQGNDELSHMPGMSPGQQVINEIHSFDLLLSYTFNGRLTLTLDVPIVYGERRSREEHLGMDRIDLPHFETSASGLGDIRLTADYWLLNPETHHHGNIALGFGVKMPTGEDDATDTFHHPAGPVRQPVDQAIQPGDGGWGIIVQLQAYQRVADRLNFYANGFYLMNPREDNGTPRVPVVMGGGPMPTGPDSVNSVPDQYLARAGFEFSLWPRGGLSISIGGRMEGIPRSDLIGGEDGFRRPGYTISVEPGLNWVYERHAFSLTAPVALERNRQRSTTDRDLHREMYPGSFADWTLFASYSFRF